MVALFSFLLVRQRPMGNSCENVGRFFKSPSGQVKKLSYRFSFLWVRPQAHGGLYGKGAKLVLGSKMGGAVR